MPRAKRPDEMSEAELAGFYQKQRGDTSLWSKTPRPMRRRRGQGPSTAFAVRLTPAELEELTAAAGRSGTTLSDFIRSASLTAARSDAPDAGERLRDIVANARKQIQGVDETLRELDAAR
jgi:uncharacterized protein (DUF1778 family)